MARPLLPRIAPGKVAEPDWPSLPKGETFPKYIERTTGLRLSRLQLWAANALDDALGLTGEPKPHTTVILALGVRVGKTTVLAAPAAALSVIRRRASVLAFSANEGLASGLMLPCIRDSLTRAGADSIVDPSYDARGSFRLLNGRMVRASGLGSGSGTGWGSQVTLIDDPVADSNTLRSSATMAQLGGILSSVVFSRSEGPLYQTILISSRQGRGDVTDLLLNAWREDNGEALGDLHVIAAPAIVEPGITDRLRAEYQGPANVTLHLPPWLEAAETDAPGTSIDEARLPIRGLRAKATMMGTRAAASLLQQCPPDDGQDLALDPALIPGITLSEVISQRPWRILVGVDCGMGAGGGDANGIVAVAQFQHGDAARFAVVKCEARVAPVLGLVADLQALTALLGDHMPGVPIVHVVESQAAGTALVRGLGHRIGSCVLHPARLSKAVRLAKVGVLCEGGRLSAVQTGLNAHGWGSLRDELGQVTHSGVRGRSPNIADALSIVVDWALGSRVVVSRLTGGNGSRPFSPWDVSEGRHIVS